MKANTTDLIKFLEGHNKEFLIPVYQRNYDWKATEQCSVLWADLENIITNNNATHFFGSIVSIRDDTRDGEGYIIIDGQQRITTISILLMAIVQKCQEYQESPTIKDSDIELPDIREIQELYIGKYTDIEKLKLKLIKDDMTAFAKIREKSDFYKESNITKNYKFFMSSLKPENVNSIYNAIRQLKIVDIKLTPSEDDPQLVFESLNSKGLKLSESDKIRNFVLIGLDYKTQEMYYEKYWSPIERNSGIDSDDTSKYIRYFIAFATDKIPKKGGVYQSFKEYRSKHETEHLLRQMMDFSYIYKQLTTQSFDADDINLRLENLITKLKSEVSIPLLFDVFSKYEAGDIPKADVIEIIKIIEAYVVRRAVCGMGTNGTDKIFLMRSEIENVMERRNSTYLDTFKHLMYKNSDALRFPNDAEFYEALLVRDIYTAHQSHCKYLLENIENYDSKERIDSSNLSVEHIMPQKLTPEWRAYLGPNHQKIHDTNVHTLGNLTLTGYNSEYSNKSFAFKKQTENGFNQSPLRLNRFMKESTDWCEESIQSRGKELRELAIKIWPSYKPVGDYSDRKDIDEITLNYDASLTRHKPNRFVFMGKDIKIEDWRHLYAEMLNILYEAHKERMQIAFDYGNDGKFRNIISDKEENRGLKGEIFWKQLIPGNPVYFRINKSADDIRKTIFIWFEFLGLDPDDLKIYFK